MAISAKKAIEAAKGSKGFATTIKRKVIRGGRRGGIGHNDMLIIAKMAELLDEE